MNDKFAIVFCFLTFAVRKSEQSIRSADDDDTANLKNLCTCLDVILKEHFSQLQNVPIISRRPVDFVYSTDLCFSKVIDDSWDFERLKISVATNNAVLFLEGDSFEKDLSVLRTLKRFHPRGRYVVYVDTNHFDEISRRLYLTKVAEFAAETWAWNTVILTTFNLDVQVFTFVKYTPGNCHGRVNLVHHGHCSEKNSRKQIYSKYVNFHKCPMILATFDLKPYNFTSYVGQDNEPMVDIESNLVNLLVDKFNATSTYLAVSMSANGTNTNESATGIGLREIIGAGQADLGWGYMLQKETPGVSYSTSYLFLKVVITLPKPNRYPPWMTLLLPLRLEARKYNIDDTYIPLDDQFYDYWRHYLLFIFQRYFHTFQVWIVFGITVAFAGTLCVFVSSYRKEYPMKLVFLALSSIGVLGIAGFRQRFYFLSWVLASYVLTQAYLASLTGCFTRPSIQPQVKTLDQLESTRTVVGGLSAVQEIFQNSSPRIYREYKRMSAKEYVENAEKLTNGETALGTHLVQFTDVAAADRMKYHVIPEPIGCFPVALLAPNTSPILGGCDAAIAAIFEAGFVELWKKDFGKRIPQQKDDDRPNSLQELMPVFYLLLVGSCLGLVFFVLELIFPPGNSGHGLL